MGIYPVLAKYYDDLFPAKEPALQFLANRVVPGGTLLDIGCGTGAHCCALADRGFSVSGIDPDPLMIEMAQKKVTGDNPEFHVAGFESIRTLRKSFRNSDFDTVSCIGNTLVHLPDMQAISDSFAAVYDILKPGGMYIVQIVNYDRILKENVSSLPPLKGGNATLQRLYSIVEGGKAVQFEIHLTINEGSGEQIFKDYVRLLPLGSRQLVDIAESAGFSETGLYGNYQEDPYSPESSATIATLQKK